MALNENDARRLEDLQQSWNERFIQQPKLPTSALLTGALSMALAFGCGLFLLSVRVRGYAWIWLVLSVLMGFLNRILARHWYRHVVIPWDSDRRSTAAEIKALEQRRDAL